MNKYHQCRQRLAFKFCHEQFTTIAWMEQIIRTLIIFAGVNSKSVPLPGREQHPMKALEIRPNPYGDPLFFGQTNVISAFLLHAAKDVFLCAPQSDHNGSRRLDILPTPDPGRGVRRGEIPPSVWFHCEADCLFSSADQIEFIPKIGLR